MDLESVYEDDMMLTGMQSHAEIKAVVSDLAMVVRDQGLQLEFLKRKYGQLSKINQHRDCIADGCLKKRGVV